MAGKIWRMAHSRMAELGPRSRVMGVLNVTPDSFSDGGQFFEPDRAVERARAMIAEGAAFIDIGGESTRPGAAAVSPAEEQRRVLPVIEALTGDALISIDTRHAETARAAVKAGAHILNDIGGLQSDREIARVAAETGAGLIIMHTDRGRQRLPDLIDDQFTFLRESLRIAAEAGVRPEQIVLDPGFGFAKNEPKENLEIISRFDELAALGHPLLVGVSRKRFVGFVTGREAAERDVGTAAANALLRLKGADVFRVHNVAFTVDALAVVDAVLSVNGKCESPGS